MFTVYISVYHRKIHVSAFLLVTGRHGTHEVPPKRTPGFLTPVDPLHLRAPGRAARAFQRSVQFPDGYWLWLKGLNAMASWGPEPHMIRVLTCEKTIQ